MSLSDDLLNELTSVGRIESEGEFSLDRDKARQKMRRFQLADPRSYVLELVQAAVLKDATAMRFDIDPVEMVMAFDGQPFTLEDFDDIYSAVFTRRRDRPVLARKQLALGLNAAMALEPVSITVTSGDGTGRGARLVLRPGEQTHDEFEAIDTDLQGTRIVLRERFRAGVVLDFFKNLAGEVAEEHLLRRRCVFSTLAIDLEGRRVDRGLHVPAGVVDEVPIEADGVRGVCGFTLNREVPAALHVVKDGVWITTVDRPTLPRGFVAVVEGRDLVKDVSQSDIVRDEAWARLEAAVNAGWQRAIVRLAERVGANEPAPDWALDQVLDVMGDVRAIDRDTRVALADAIEALPVWVTTLATVDLRAIRAEVARRGEVFVAPDGLEVLVPEELAFVLRPTRAQRRALVGLFGKRLNRDADALERLMTRERNRLAWRRRRAMPELPTHHRWLARHRIETDGVRAEVGITLDADRLDVRLIKDDCLLESVEAPGLLGLCIAVEADFTPDEMFAGVERDDPALDVMLVCLEGIVVMLESMPWSTLCARDEATTERATQILELLKTETGSLAPPLLRALGFERWGKRLTRFGRHRLRVDLVGRGRPPHSHPLAEVALLPRLDGTRASLAELDAERRGENRRIGYVRPPVEEAVEAPIVLVDDMSLGLLTWVFGREALSDATKDVERLVARAWFLQRPVQAATLSQVPGHAVRVTLDDGQGVRGEVAVWVGDATHRRHEVPLLLEQRRIDTLELYLPGGFAAVVESDHLEPTVKWERVKRNSALDAVQAAIAQAWVAAIRVLCARLARSSDQQLRAFLREVATMVFVTPELRALYEAELGADKLEDNAWSRLTALPTELLGSLASAVRGILNANEPQSSLRRKLKSLAGRPAQAAIVEAVFPNDRARTWAERAREPIAELADAELFTLVDGSPITLAALAARAARSQPVYVVQETRFSTELETDSPVVDLDSDRAHEVLFQIFGRRAVRDGSGLVERARRRARHASRPRLERIELADGLARIKLPITGAEPLHGEVGLKQVHPGDPLQRFEATLHVHADGRFVDVVSRRGNGRGHLVAAVDDTRFTLTPDMSTVVDDGALYRVEQICAEHHGRLIAELLEHWPTLDGAAQTSARRHLLDFVVTSLPSKRWRKRPDKVLDRDPLLRRIVELPLLATVAGPPRSLASILEHSGNKPVEFLYELDPTAEPPEGFDPATLVLDTFEEARLAEIFGQTHHLGARWTQLTERARNRAIAHPPTMWRDGDVLVRHPIEHDRLTGEVVLPVDRHAEQAIELCVEGKVVAAIKPSRRCPGAGHVSGRGVQVADDWSTAGLDSHALAMVQRALVAAYTELARRLGAHEVGAAHANAADRLGQTLVDLHHARRSGEVSADQEALYQRLARLPLLPTRLGVRITLEQALETHPPELASLELWRPGPPAGTLDPPAGAPPAGVAGIPPAGGGAAEPPAPLSPGGDVPSAGGRADGSEASRGRPGGAASQRAEPAVDPIPPQGGPRGAASPAGGGAGEAGGGGPELLTDSVRELLRLIRQRNRRLLDEPHLDEIRIDTSHVTVREALARHADDPVWTMLVASSTYTALNVEHGAITDSDEVEFHRQLALLADQ